MNLRKLRFSVLKPNVKSVCGWLLDWQADGSISKGIRMRLPIRVPMADVFNNLDARTQTQTHTRARRARTHKHTYRLKNRSIHD